MAGVRTEEKPFIYRQKIEAATLEQERPGLDVEEKYEICRQLRCILNELRQLQQDSSNPFIGEHYSLFVGYYGV
jgi:hypothetical protein